MAGAAAARPTSQDDLPQRPRVALVFSSGGARALAQLGVLRGLEARRVPVDLVVGSETGALIGGLYAAGLSPEEIEALLVSEAWVTALSGSTPRRNQSWRQRTVERDFLIPLPVALGPSHMGLRSGFARTRWISWLLSSALFQAAAVDDFEQLPTPFRAVASDLLSGEPVVLAGGDLPTALLASFSTPGRYAPVDWGGRALASGALLNPVPVDVARNWGAEIVLLVDVAATLEGEERLDSFLSADLQARLVAGDVHRSRGLALLQTTDLRLTPDIDELDEEDYRAAARWIRAGERAIEAAGAALSSLALDEAEWANHLEARRSRRLPFPRIRQVHFRDDSGLQRSVLAARVRTQPGDLLDPQRLAGDVLRLYGLDYHERIDVRIQPDGQGSADLQIEGEASEQDLWAPRAGVAFEGVFGQDASFVAGGAFTLRPITASGAEWRNRVELGSRVLLRSEYWQPLEDTATWFLAPSVAFAQLRANVTVENQVLATYDVTAVAARLQLGRTLGNVGDIRVGVVADALDAELAIGDPTSFQSLATSEGYGEVRLAIDTLDNLALPSTGTIARAVGTAPIDFLGGEEQSFLSLQIDQPWTFGRTTLVLGAEYNTALNGEQNLSTFFPLGGFLRLSGLGRDSVGGAHSALARAVVWHGLDAPTLEVRMVEWYLGASVEAGQTWLRRGDVDLGDLRPSSSLFVAANTILGPVFLGVGWTDPSEVAGFLTFGNLFGNWDDE